ncbi:MAG TPA: serine/threonine-protein kinase, partial [Pyrinomonadaceae bacterium]|nr:serine/threonine-protein kinase [Pyrinomonadaceae bacterium]
MTDLQRYVGQVLDDKYRLERLLGQGGMGAVFLATHLGTDRYVALKLIAPQFMRNQEFVERFKREARAAGRLRHPNVVDVTDFGFSGDGEDQVAYLVMEYLDGCTLSDVLTEENRLPLYWVVDILEQVCGAVQEAHQQGIVHRDLKPDNIWLEPNGLGGYRVKVLDFGIAKLAENGSALPAATGPSAQLQPTAAAPSLEAVTMIYPSDATTDGEEATQIMPPVEQQTRVLDSARDTAARPQETAAALGTAASGLTRI